MTTKDGMTSFTRAKNASPAVQHGEEKLVDKVEIFQDEAGEYRWRRLGPNGEPVSSSGEGYVSHDYIKGRAAQLNPGCLIVDLVTEGEGDGEGTAE